MGIDVSERRKVPLKDLVGAPAVRCVYLPLAPRILAVAVVDEVVREWVAYIDTTPGLDYKLECRFVVKTGTKLAETVAKALFPDLARCYRWRRWEDGNA